MVELILPSYSIHLRVNKIILCQFIVKPFLLPVILVYMTLCSHIEFGEVHFVNFVLSDIAILVLQLRCVILSISF